MESSSQSRLHGEINKKIFLCPQKAHSLKGLQKRYTPKYWKVLHGVVKREFPPPLIVKGTSLKSVCLPYILAFIYPAHVAFY